MFDKHTCFHFSQNNPFGPGQDNLPTLLRRFAESVEELGPIVPLNLIMEVAINDDGFLPVMTLYTGWKMSRNDDVA